MSTPFIKNKIESKTLQPGNGYQVPPAAYTTQEWLDREQTNLFAAGWNFVCTSADLAKVGDYQTAQIGSYPIVIVRGSDDVVRGFHNLCRHRGAKMLDDAGTCDRLKCPYHFWQYSLDGELVSVPQGRQQMPDMDRSDWGLLPVEIGIFMGLVFANPDGKAEPFDTWLGGARQLLEDFRLDELTQLEKVEYVFDANWKFYIENHIDWYHLWYTHENTLNVLDHKAGDYRQVGKHWLSWEPYKSSDKNMQPFTPLVGLSALNHLNGAHLLFPNLTLFSGAGWFGTGHITPVAPDKSRMSFRLWALPGQDAERFLQGFHQITQVEDADMARRLQAGVNSPAFQVGPMTQDYEKSITEFHDHYLQAMK